MSDRIPGRLPGVDATVSGRDRLATAAMQRAIQIAYGGVSRGEQIRQSPRLAPDPSRREPSPFEGSSRAVAQTAIARATTIIYARVIRRVLPLALTTERPGTCSMKAIAKLDVGSVSTTGSNRNNCAPPFNACSNSFRRLASAGRPRCRTRECRGRPRSAICRSTPSGRCRRSAPCWRPALIDATTPATLVEYAASLRGKDFADGQQFCYKTVATNVVGLVLERAMGDSMVRLLSRHVWSRLPTRHDAVIVVDRSGFPYVGAGMSACARDLLTFGQMMIEGGACNGQQIVPEAWIHDTQAGDLTSKSGFAAGQYGGLLPGWHYRNQVWCTDRPGVMLAIGIHGQLIYMNTRAQTVVVKFSSQPTAVDIPSTFAGVLAADAIAESLA